MLSHCFVVCKLKYLSVCFSSLLETEKITRKLQLRQYFLCICRILLHLSKKHLAVIFFIKNMAATGIHILSRDSLSHNLSLKTGNNVDYYKKPPSFMSTLLNKVLEKHHIQKTKWSLGKNFLSQRLVQVTSLIERNNLF